MNNDLAHKWDNTYRNLSLDPHQVATVLKENAFLLPNQGTALDLACALAGNSVFLARQGLTVTAWDISTIAIQKLHIFARQNHLTITARQQAIEPADFSQNSFDVILVSRFLDRSLMNAIISALKPQGLLFYQTFTLEQTPSPDGSTRRIPSNPDYLFAENELLRLFSSLRVIYYRENGLLGNTTAGLRNEAQFIGQKSA